MRRFLSAASIMLVALLVLSGSVRAADAPYAGTWKVIVYQGNSELSLFLLKIEEKAAGPKIEVLDALPNFKTAKVEAAKPDGDALKFTSEGGLPLKFAFYPAKGEKEPKKMLGSVEIRGTTDFALIERTDEKELDANARQKPAEGSEDFIKALRTTDAKEKETALKEFAEKHTNSPLGFRAAVELMGTMSTNAAADKDVKAAAEQAIKIAGTFGPEMKQGGVAMVTQRLIAAKKSPAVALEYARQVEKSLPKDAKPAQQMSALKMLLSALKQAEKTDEIKEINERVAKLDKVLDEEFLKTAVPFKTKTFERESKGEKVAVVELFTGAQCPPCVAADVAFDAALKTYKPQDVILLQYHLHIPGPDALTNDDTEKRAKYYPLRGVPSTYVNGGADLGLGGGKDAGENSFGRLATSVKKQLENDTTAKIKLAAKPTGADKDNLGINVEVTDLKDAGEDMKLRLVLVEEMVRYPGNNGQRFHHHVVRMMPGGVDGFDLKDATTKQEVKVNLAELKKSLAEYLDKANTRRPFLSDDRPLDLKHLKVVAFIQNDKTKEILQATQVDLNEGK